MNLSILFGFICLLSVVSGGPLRFDNHKVIRISPQSKDQLDFLVELRKNTSLDFWVEPSRLGRDVDLRLDEAQCDWVCKQLKDRSILHRTFIEDVQALIDRQMEPNPDDFYSQYNSYADIITWIKGLQTQYPHLVTLINLGNSYEGRELLAVKVTASNATNTPAIWFDGCIHAREWIATATVIYMLGNLLSDYSRDPTVTRLVNGLEIYVLPVFNADGYSYTWTDNRMWRKTRSPNAGSTCIGTDPNRNWDFHWNGADSSNNPCDDTYIGSKAFSEVEVRTVGEYIKNANAQTNKFKGYINFHSYSQLWMSPWGYTSDLPKDYNVQNSLSAKCAAAIQAGGYNTEYQYGPISTTIYPASGSSADYTYGVANVLYSYGVELRDTGEYGFLLPPDQIVPSGIETYAALKLWATAALG
jgi:murein tripeptide amidase MpaA